MTSKPKRSFFQPRFSVRTLLILVTLCAAGLFGRQKWVEYRNLEIAREWVAQLDMQSFGPQCPVKTSRRIELESLLAGALHLESTFQKTACLKILAEQYPNQCLDPLIQVALRCDDVEVQLVAIHLLSLKRDVNALGRLKSLVENPDPRIRAARLDCIGITRVLTYPEIMQTTGFFGMEESIECTPPIYMWPMISGKPILQRLATSAFERLVPTISPYEAHPEFPNRYRNELKQVMLGENSSPEERAAAARAIVAWPPADYQLRFAEWGVWINANGEFHLVDSIIDEIPAFVHRTGNELQSFEDRLTIPMVITKPVIHLTTDQPLAVDLSVSFNMGRPWFAYPRPDDFQIEKQFFSNRDESPIHDLDDVEIEELNPIREGYPWMLPLHRQHHTSVGKVKEINGLGLHWQSVIVSPTKAPWMNPPNVDPDPKYSWWSELRDVDCSWISNQNESERFIYYDGPTLAQSPLDIFYDLDEISVSKRSLFPPDNEHDLNYESVNETILEGPNKVDESLKQLINTLGMGSTVWKEVDNRQASRDGFFIRVDENGMKGIPITLKDKLDVDLNELDLLNSEQLRKSMLDSIMIAGLNLQEAEGLLKCWTPAFFEEPGQRIVFLLHRSEYDLMCPLTIRPEPTEKVRVGLVLTELLD